MLRFTADVPRPYTSATPSITRSYPIPTPAADFPQAIPLRTVAHAAPQPLTPQGNDPLDPAVINAANILVPYQPTPQPKAHLTAPCDADDYLAPFHFLWHLFDKRDLPTKPSSAQQIPIVHGQWPQSELTAEPSQPSFTPVPIPAIDDLRAWYAAQMESHPHMTGSGNTLKSSWALKALTLGVVGVALIM